jgi:hypothetical protein
MTVNTESTSRKSLIHAGEVELVEFFVQRPAADDQDHEIACSDARALVRAADGDAVADSARLVVGKVVKDSRRENLSRKRAGINASLASYQH